MLADSKSLIPNPSERPPANESRKMQWAEVNYGGVRFLIGSFGGRSAAGDNKQGDLSVTEIEQVTHVG